ncbi:coiled-coil domain-containing protein 33-like [Littorina saxatilis]|uniref:C2 domain-containing protein n=1 Tax=Littorina saxatilis TaxID=31220 RepID=A0AAN9GP58_9CAEN
MSYRASRMTSYRGTSRYEDGSVTPRPTNIENKVLEYDVDILDVQFNHTGRYFIKMTVQSLATRDYSKVELRRWPQDVFAKDHEALTDVVVQSKKDQVVNFQNKKFTFRLPKGFCKNDKNHDVYLLVEAFSLPPNSEGSGKKVGEGKVAIYPRTNAPRPNHSASPGQDIYRYDGIVSLLRTAQVDKSQMHCGRMRCNLGMHETLPIMTPARPPLDREASTSPRTGRTPRPPPPKKTENDLENRKKRAEVYDDYTPPPRRHPPVIRTPVPPPPRHGSPSSLWGDTVSLNLPKSPSPPPLTDGKRLTDSPLPELNQSTYSANPSWRHTARKGNEQIDVIVHGASSLPTPRDGHVPLPYVTLKTRHDDDVGAKARAKTHASVRPTHVPSWEELVSLEIDDAKAENEALVLSVGDAVSKQGLVKYHIPVSSLKPFHQYHMEMVLPAKNTRGVKTYVSITRRQSTLPKDPGSPNYLALEAYLRAVQKPLLNPAGPLTAVARIVPDFHNYRSDTLQPRTAGLGMTSLTFPNPHPSSFKVAEQSNHGYPQISLVGRPAEQPRWNHPFLFCDTREKATMFTPSAALILEYYESNSAMTDEFWKIRKPVGFSAVLLDQRMYTRLMKENAKEGLRVEGVPIQGSDLFTLEDTTPTVGMVLKLVTTDQPTSMVAMSNLDNLPAVRLHATDGANHAPDIITFGDEDIAYQYGLGDLPNEGQQQEGQGERGRGRGEEEGEEEEDDLQLDLSSVASRISTEAMLEDLEGNQSETRSRWKNLLPIKDGEMPPYDAMESILPEYQYIFNDPNASAGAQATRPAPAPTVQASRRTVNADLDATTMSIMDQQMREMDNYRQAVTRMGQDIMTLRNNLREVEGTNSKLRLQVGNYSDTTRIMTDSTQVDGLTKGDLVSRYTTLRQKLASQTTELKQYKDKVQKLQNELIKKNDKEKEYLRMSHAHASQQELLQRLQEKVNKVRRLEETCRKQEKVIEKLERIVDKLRDKSHIPKDVNADTSSALMEENKRLRQQMEEMRDQLMRAGKAGTEDMEKLELYQALERAEGRIMSLEKQLAENSRQWGRERADLQIRMNENEHGFGRSGGMVLHDYPVL